MPVFRDQLNREVLLENTPKRIISIVPSQTELLFYMGLDDEIIGITKFCTHPKEKVFNRTKIGGTKQLDIELIEKLQPDLIIANKEENDRSQVEELAARYPVWISEINTLTDAVSMVESVGEMLDRKREAKALSDAINIKFTKKPPIITLNLRVGYVIWRKPYMVAGTGTFIDSMLQACGLTNAFDAARYPEVDATMLVRASPDIILLSSEPYPFKEKHIAEFRALLPRAKVILVDGEMFSWYGSRLLLAPEYFASVVGINNITF